jgi:hypothetical protein
MWLKAGEVSRLKGLMEDLAERLGSTAVAAERLP